MNELKLKVAKALVGLGAAALIASCSSSEVMGVGERIPAAKAEVKASDTGNGDTKVDLKVEHLAKAEDLKDGASTYVVWIQKLDDEPGAPAQNAGQLHLNENLEGRFETITPFRDFRLFVTAEPYASVTAPTGYRALWTTVNN